MLVDPQRQGCSAYAGFASALDRAPASTVVEAPVTYAPAPATYATAPATYATEPATTYAAAPATYTAALTYQFPASASMIAYPQTSAPGISTSSELFF